MSVNIDSPWEIDDFQRRVFQNLFSDQVPEREQVRRRRRRSALVILFEGVLEDDAEKLAVATQTLLDTVPSAPIPLLPPLAPT